MGTQGETAINIPNIEEKALHKVKKREPKPQPDVDFNMFDSITSS